MTTIRDNKPLDLQRWQRGERLRAEKLNRSVDAINRLKNGIAFPRQVRTVRGGKGEAAKPIAGAQRQLVVAWGVFASSATSRAFELFIRRVTVDYRGTSPGRDRLRVAWVTAASQDETNDFYSSTESGNEFGSLFFADPSFSFSEWQGYVISRFVPSINPAGGVLEPFELAKLLAVDRMDDSVTVFGEPARGQLQNDYGFPVNLYMVRPMRWPL